LHVGSHVPAAAQVVDDAFVVEHARPHAPQLAVVSVEPQPASCPPELLPLLDPLELPDELPELLPELLLLESSPPSSPPLPELLPLLEPLELPDELPLDDVPPLLEPLDEVLPLELVDPLLEPLLEPLPELLLLELLGPAPPMQTGTVVDVPFGAAASQVVPEGHPCDESQKGTHCPPMQMSFEPHVAVPCVSSHAAPWEPGPALMHE